MAKSNGTGTCTSDERPAPEQLISQVSLTQQEAPVCVAALSIDYLGRFDECDIPSSEIRTSMNAACRALDGIAAITKVLYSNEIERHSQGEQAVTLDSSTAYGLFEALSLLVEQGNSNATNLGIALSRDAKGAA